MSRPTSFVRRVSAWIAVRMLVVAYPEYFASLKEWPSTFMLLPVLIPAEQSYAQNNSKEVSESDKWPPLSLILPRPLTRPNDNLFTYLQ